MFTSLDSNLKGTLNNHTETHYFDGTFSKNKESDILQSHYLLFYIKVLCMCMQGAMWDFKYQ